MSNSTISRFVSLWNDYFPGCELPIGFVYSESDQGVACSHGSSHCMIAELGTVRKGKPVAFTLSSLRCTGAKRYLGFSEDLRPNFEYFLSCGIDGELEGERYKKSPRLVSDQLKQQVPFEAPHSHIIFRRLDVYEDGHPEVVIFFADADVLSGLFTLANFDSPVVDGVAAPFGSGCSAIVYYPYHEADAVHPKAILGMFDVSARPHVPSNQLTFAVPWRKFESMVNNMPESFLITNSWGKVRRRVGTVAQRS